MKRTTKRVLWQWWRSRQNEWAYSGLALWVDLYRDWRCAKLRAERRERDLLTQKRMTASKQRSGTLAELLVFKECRAYNSQAAYLANAQQAAQNPYAHRGLQQASNYDPYGNLLGLGRIF